MCCWVVLLLATSYACADFDDHVAALANGSYSKKGSAVEALAATGDDRAVPILEAMLEGNLYTRKSDDRVVIGDAQGQIIVLIDPMTMTELEQLPKRELKKGSR